MVVRPALIICLTVLTTLMSAAELAAAPTEAEFRTILNISGRQRMLSQKMSKEALLIGAGIDIKDNQRLLEDTRHLFEISMSGLIHGDDSLGLPMNEYPPIVDRLVAVGELYQKMQPVLARALQMPHLGTGDLRALAAQNVTILDEMDAAVLMFEEEARAVLIPDPDRARQINLAGKQRMLTQRMTKEALLVFFGVDVEGFDNRQSLLDNAGLFTRTLAGLRDGDAGLDLAGTDDPVIRAQLERVSQLWIEARPVIEYIARPDTLVLLPDLQKLDRLGLALLEESDRVVSLFEEE